MKQEDGQNPLIDIKGGFRGLESGMDMHSYPPAAGGVRAWTILRAFSFGRRPISSSALDDDCCLMLRSRSVHVINFDLEIRSIHAFNQYTHTVEQIRQRLDERECCCRGRRGGAIIIGYSSAAAV